MRPPVGVAILAFFALINGIADAVLGLQLMGIVAFGPVSTGNGVFFSGLISFGLGVLYLALAYAAWNLRIWAWTFGMLLGALGIMNAFFVTIASGSVANGLAAALLPALILWYLNTEGVKEAFVRGEQDAGLYASSYDREQAERIKAERSTD
jgi:hypothetical protein